MNPDIFFNDGLGIMLGLVLVLAYVVFIIYAICAAVLSIIGWYTLAKRRGLEYPWMCLMPIGSDYIVGKLADGAKLFGHRFKKPQFLMPIMTMIYGVVAGIAYGIFYLVFMAEMMVYSSSAILSSATPSMGFLIGLLVFLLVVILLAIPYAFVYYALLYRIYKIYKPRSAVALLVVSILFAFVQPFIIFAIRNASPVGLEEEAPVLALDVE